MASAKLKKQERKFRQIELTIENQEELDVLIALLGCTSTKKELREKMCECTRIEQKYSQLHVNAQFNLFNVLINPLG